MTCELYNLYTVTRPFKAVETVLIHEDALLDSCPQDFVVRPDECEIEFVCEVTIESDDEDCPELPDCFQG